MRVQQVRTLLAFASLVSGCSLLLDVSDSLTCDGPRQCPEERRCYNGRCGSTEPQCGDFILDQDEACDEGLANSNDLANSCRLNCTVPFCGDGVTDAGEACDDGLRNGDYSLCKRDCSGPGPRCGDGVIQSDHEVCESQLSDPCAPCLPDCSAISVGAICGDGRVCDEAELCDDGFTDACGTCNASCTGVGLGATCGDQQVCPELEICDDGFADACGTCNATCTGAGTGASCGDGQLCPEFEACDDGFADACGTCNATCTAVGAGATCGDGVICPEVEVCDESTHSSCCGCSDTACIGDEMCDGSQCSGPITFDDFEMLDAWENESFSPFGVSWHVASTGYEGSSAASICNGYPSTCEAFNTSRLKRTLYLTQPSTIRLKVFVERLILRLLIDGTEAWLISGSQLSPYQDAPAWLTMEVIVPAGEHEVTIQTLYSGAVWIDDLQVFATP